jgi:hypothetical protein
MAILYYKHYSCNTKSREARLEGALVSYEGLTNRIRSFSVHCCLPALAMVSG